MSSTILILKNGWFAEVLYKILLSLDGIVYSFVNWLYQVFLVIAKGRIFTSDVFAEFSSKIYAILGVAMLFVVAFQLLNAIINPDMLSKGDKSVGKIAGNIVISLVMLTFVGTAFKYLYIVQQQVLNTNLIEKIMLTTGSSDQENKTTVEAGNEMAANVMFAFLFPTTGSPAEVCGGSNYGNVTRDSINVPQCITDNSSNPYANYCCASEASRLDGNYFRLAGDEAYLTETINEDGNPEKIEYTWLISTAAGVFVCYILVSFCLDIGVRCAKLGFYQLIAPIPILMRIIPSKKAQFDKYIKDVISTFLDVFTRLIIIYFAVYVCTLIPGVIETIFASSTTNDTGWVIRALATVAIILGVLSFAKSAPKMISELLGVTNGNIALGIKKKLSDNKLAMAGVGAIGTGVGGLVRNGFNAASNIKNAGPGWKNKTGAVLKGVGSTIAGGASGMRRGAQAGYKLDDVSKMGATINASRDQVEAARDKREAYKEAHPGFGGVAKGRATEAVSSVKKWATGEGDILLQRRNEGLRTIEKDKDAIKGLLDKDKRVTDAQAVAKDALEQFAKNWTSSAASEIKDANGNVVGHYGLDSKQYAEAYTNQRKKMDALVDEQRDLVYQKKMLDGDQELVPLVERMVKDLKANSSSLVNGKGEEIKIKIGKDYSSGLGAADGSGTATDVSEIVKGLEASIKNPQNVSDPHVFGEFIGGMGAATGKQARANDAKIRENAEKKK